MTTQEIIDWRTSLKGGRNIPLRIIFDNQFNVDESSVFTYVKWDDNNGIIYIFRLPNFSDSTNPNNVPNAFQVFSAPYDKIWYLVATTPMQFIDDVFKSRFQRVSTSAAVKKRTSFTASLSRGLYLQYSRLIV